MNQIMTTLLVGILVVAGVLFFIALSEGDTFASGVLLVAYAIFACLLFVAVGIPRIREYRASAAFSRRANDTYQLLRAGLPPKLS